VGGRCPTFRDSVVALQAVTLQHMTREMRIQILRLESIKARIPGDLFGVIKEQFWH